MAPGYQGGNRLLDALPSAEVRNIAPQLSIVAIPTRELIEEPGREKEFVDFPIDAVYSVIATLSDGNTCEVGTVGREGFVAADAIIGQRVPRRTTVCQVGGTSARMRADAFQRTLRTSGGLRRLTERNLSARLFAAEQFTTCNLMHQVAERCARWLLMTRDRVGRDEFNLTQDYLATMLGVRRAGVAQAASSLKSAGTIEYRRGHVIVADGPRLEAAACECYFVTRDAFEEALA